jgi:hypothetical protein
MLDFEERTKREFEELLERSAKKIQLMLEISKDCDKETETMAIRAGLAMYTKDLARLAEKTHAECN